MSCAGRPVIAAVPVHKKGKIMKRNLRNRIAAGAIVVTAASFAVTGSMTARAAASGKTVRATASRTWSKAPAVRKGKNIITLNSRKSGTVLYVRFRAGRNASYRFRFSSLHYTNRKARSKAKDFVFLGIGFQYLQKGNLVFRKIHNGYQQKMLFLSSRQAYRQLNRWNSSGSGVDASIRNYAKKCIQVYHFRPRRRTTMRLKKGQVIYLVMSANGSGGVNKGAGTFRLRLTVETTS